MMKRITTAAASLLRRRYQYQRALLISSASSLSICSGRQSTQALTHNFDNSINNNKLYFSSLAQDDWDDEDDNNQTPPPKQQSSLLLPTKHSRNLPSPVCPASTLRSEVESIFDAPLGSLIVYTKSEVSTELKSVEDEMESAYFASDEIVQRVEYIMRGLNARISKDNSFVSRCLKQGVMEYDDVDTTNVNGDEDMLGKDECFRAMVDLIQRMTAEGDTYAELRTRVRSQLLDPSSVDESSSSSSSSDSSSDSDNEGGAAELNEQQLEDAGDKSFNRWEEEMTANMKKAGFSNKKTAGLDKGIDDNTLDDTTSPERNKEEYQFGSNPGLTTHMYDLILDSLACLCQEHSKDSSLANLVDIMPEDEGSPPELAKAMLDTVLSRHWMDGGDIGVGNGGADNPFGKVGEGIGIASGTGAGNLATLDLFSRNFDERTTPTSMTFNAVLRIAANFDPVAYAEAVENAKVLGGDMGNTSSSMSNTDQLKQEQERLRDVTIDAALSTYSRMHDCSALTLRTLKNSTKLATARSSLKRQAKLLTDNFKGKRKNDVISGRNSATYAYLIQTISNCIPPSLSRGNMAFALYHKGCVEEGVMDTNVINAMRSVGGYGAEDDTDVIGEESGSEDEPMAPPPISNGALFDSFMQKELGSGVTAAMDKGRNMRQDRNYKLRRHCDWDDTY